jgi:hypothetical protein
VSRALDPFGPRRSSTSRENRVWLSPIAINA